jgi:hypothetical protein
MKNISLLQKCKSDYIFAHLVLLRRASAVVTDVGRGAVDADVAKTNATKAYGEGAWSWHPVAGVKPLEKPKADQGRWWQDSPFTRESAL